ncbi:hemolysin family protein [Helicobacter sp. MIT 05-5294]|uniref:hemolysin family protein n=1 Tax=Helicobacter sp. MIT 05-5294 TaxID=1548150 RepID=UPI00051FD7A5|nr:hemolysin family protein [Helicobacter sp. MIT 05-5294]TLD88180.1 HlyC/CorC family transporter [Helicobacter sp. MIT 05-5294]
MDTESFLLALFALFLVLLNGFFVLSEFAIVKIRRSRLEELSKREVPSAKLALKITGKLDSYLSATQLGITLSSLGLGWVGEPAIARLLEGSFKYFLGDNPVLLHSVSFVIAFSLITLLHVVAGELIPKSVAIAKAEKAVLFVAKPLHMFWILFFPLIRIFDYLAIFSLHKMGIKPASEGEENAHSEEELRIIVGESLKGGYLDTIENEIIQNAVSFSDTMAKEIMTPRKDMICLYDDNTYEENMKIVTSTKHTRYPYCKEGKDNIIGMVHLRDLLETMLSENSSKDLESLIREIIIVPESASISNILIQMNRRQIHTALVVDEYGGTAGLLTMEDILEEVIGDISDEHDKKSEDYHKIDEDSYSFDGMLDLERVADILGIEFEKDTEQVTIGGYVFNLLERMPVVGDMISDEYCEYEVLATQGARIVRLRATRKTSKES